MADMEKIRARGADPATLVEAQVRSDAIFARIDTAAGKKLAERAKAATSKQAKVVILRQLGDGVVKASSGIAPCAKGCNHCCKMATLVSVEEAEVMARELRLKMTMPTRFNQFTDDWQKEYEGVACTFLTDAGCSIYAQRPYACRVHVSVDKDALLCEIVPGVKIRAPTVRTTWFDQAFVQAFGGPATMKYADIREFFPPRTGKKE